MEKLSRRGCPNREDMLERVILFSARDSSSAFIDHVSASLTRRSLGPALNSSRPADTVGGEDNREIFQQGLIVFPVPLPEILQRPSVSLLLPDSSNSEYRADRHHD